MRKCQLRAIHGIMMMCLIVLLWHFGTLNVFAADMEVDIYAMGNWAEQYISIPEEYATEYQIIVPEGQSASYEMLSGFNVDLTDAGLVTVHKDATYWYGNIGYSKPFLGDGYDSVTYSFETGTTVIRVYIGNESFDVTINVHDYADDYAEQIMDDYLASNYSSDMTIEEQMDAICRFPAQYDYSVAYSGANGMIISGGGDCWASSDAIVRLCKKVGIEARVRNGRRDPGAGSGHMNVLAIIGEGDYYELEAGYSEPAPRYYSVTHRTSLFCYKNSGIADGICVYQYDGDLENITELIVPESIDGRKVVELGEQFVAMESNLQRIILPDTLEKIGESAFNSCTGLHTLHIPAKVSQIGDFAMTNCIGLTDFTCAQDNPYFMVKDGILYDKECTVLLSGPACSAVWVPDTVNSIKGYAFYYNSNLTEMIMRETVKEIGEGAFGECSSLSEIAVPGVEKIDSFAFVGCSNLKKVVLPKSISNMGMYAMGYNTLYQEAANEDFVIYGGTDTPAYTYAQENGITFVEVNFPFEDVAKTTWYNPYVYYVYENGLMSGTNKDANNLIKFEPEAYMTREQFVQVLYNKDTAGDLQVAYTGRFADVPENVWFTQAVEWAAKCEIVSGISLTEFGVGQNITREQMAMMLLSYAEYKGYEADMRANIAEFPDEAEVSEWAKDAMGWAVAYGIMSGKETAAGNYLSPKDRATRAECAAMMQAFVEMYE